MNLTSHDPGIGVSRDEASILSRKTGGYAVIDLWSGNYDRYHDTIKTYYGYLRDDLKASPGERPSWLDRYDQYQPDPIMALP